MTSTQTTVRIASDLQNRKGRAKSVVSQQFAREDFAHAQKNFDHFRGLKSSHHSRQNSKDSGLTAGGRHLGCRLFRVKAAVTRPGLIIKNRQLTLEAKNRRRNKRSLLQHTGVVD